MTAPQFEALLALQDIDTAIDQVRHRRSHLPALAELAEVAIQRSNLAVRTKDAQAALDVVAGRQAHLEAELAATERRSREVSARLYSGEVAAARELQALAADVEALDRRASDLEDQGLVALEEREPLDAALEARAAEAAELERRRAVADVDVAAGEQVAGAELAELEARRREALAALSADIVVTYEKLRAHLGGVGVARLVGTHCGGCHLELAATEVDQLRRLPADALVTCEQCGRILVRP